MITPNILKKIKKEKRNRNQIYYALDYYLKHISYFDFFSKDAFDIVLKSKIIAYHFNKKKITTELFLLPFFHLKTETSHLITAAVSNKGRMIKYLVDNDIDSELSPSLKEILFGIEKPSKNLNQEVIFDSSIQYLFKKCTENCLLRFKTPMITPEILFVTLMEEKQFPAYQLIKELVNNSTHWYFLRYQLIKKIHNQESKIRNEVSINQHYFAYLLRLRLNEIEFERILENQILKPSVSVFRNIVVSRILNQNIFNSLKKDIKKSIEMVSFRNYSI